VYQAVASLRRQLGDDPKQPTYVATVPRLGYRMVAQVSPWVDGRVAVQPNPPTSRAENAREVGHPGLFFSANFGWAIGAALGIALIVFLVFQSRGKLPNNGPPAFAAGAAQPQKSIAVLPFLDLTEGMKEEEFADGMTEELIDKLSKIPGLQVPSPTSSFYFKGKQIPVADIARTMGVVYVLDGSVRISGARLRVAARLVRAEIGYVIWSETYDRPFNDRIMVQDDIAAEVTKAMRASIEAAPEHSSPGH
jgi:transcriptional activator of cad operon